MLNVTKTSKFYVKLDKLTNYILENIGISHILKKIFDGLNINILNISFQK